MKTTVQKIVNKFYNWIKILEERYSDEKAEFISGIERSIQLDKYSCGAQTVYSILNYYNSSLSIDEIIKKLGVTKEDGVDTGPILNLLKEKNLKIEINDRAKLFHVKRAIRQGYPMIITVDDWEHWCVIYGYSKKNIYILDSRFSSFKNKWPREKFLKRWDDNWICIVKPEYEKESI